MDSLCEVEMNKYKEIILKHLPGQHDQKTHGRRGMTVPRNRKNESKAIENEIKTGKMSSARIEALKKVTGKWIDTGTGKPIQDMKSFFVGKPHGEAARLTIVKSGSSSDYNKPTHIGLETRVLGKIMPTVNIVNLKTGATIGPGKGFEKEFVPGYAKTVGDIFNAYAA